jgi:hypothetical protein
MARVAWERGATIEDTVPTPEMAEQPAWMRRLPRGYFGSHIAGILLAIGSPGLKHLTEFREKLASGAFGPKRQEPAEAQGGASVRTPSP